MAAITTTGPTKQYGGMTAIDDHDRAGEEDGTYNLQRYSMTEQR